MTLSEFIAELERIASQPAGSTKGEDELAALKGWDSLAMMDVMWMAEAKLGLQLEPAMISACKRVIDLASLCGIQS